MSFACKILFVNVILFTSSCMNSDKDSYVVDITYGDEIIQYPLPYRTNILLQNSTERIWKKAHVNRVYDGINVTYSPVRVQIRGDKIFVLDASDGYVKRIDYTTGDIYKLGPGKGNGPGETSFPFDFDIDSNGNFLIIDLNKISLISLDSEGNPIIDYSFKYITPTTLVSVAEGMAIIMVGGGSTLDKDEKGLFQLYEIEKNKISKYSNFLINTENLPPFIGLEMAFTGRILYDNNRLIYLPRHLNHIIYISTNGEVELARETIDEINMPKIISSGHNRESPGGFTSVKLSNDSEVANLDGFLVGDELIIWSRPGNKEFGSHIFDYYDKLNGDYKFSVKISDLGSVSGIDMNGNYIATINSDFSVSLWEYEITN